MITHRTMKPPYTHTLAKELKEKSEQAKRDLLGESDCSDDTDKTVKHVASEGSREHVLSWALINGKGVTKCSNPNCEVNR